MKYQLLEQRFDLQRGMVVDRRKSVYSSSNAATVAYEAVIEAHETVAAQHRTASVTRSGINLSGQQR